MDRERSKWLRNDKNTRIGGMTMKRSLLRTGTALLAIALAMCGGVSASALTVYSMEIPPVDSEYNG